MSELGDRGFGSAGAGLSLGVFVLWITDVDDVYRYFVTGFAVFIVCLIIGVNVLKRRHLHKKRQEQMRLHSMKNRDFAP